MRSSIWGLMFHLKNSSMPSRQHQPRFVLMSALLTLTMSMMEETIKALQKAGLRQKVKVGVGGAPLTQSFADRIGADFYGKDARVAVIKCNELVSGHWTGVTGDFKSADRR